MAKTRDWYIYPVRRPVKVQATFDFTGAELAYDILRYSQADAMMTVKAWSIFEAGAVLMPVKEEE
jgi:hypothetical protein